MKRGPDDAARRKALVRLTAAAGGVATAGAAVPFIASLAPSERAKAAGAPVELDIGALEPAQLRTV
jgi:ubiquinol-cytochrome c reductase iron-sulfur subunit